MTKEEKIKPGEYKVIMAGNIMVAQDSQPTFLHLPLTCVIRSVLFPKHDKNHIILKYIEVNLNINFKTK